MISINFNLGPLILIPLLFLSSCESLKNIAGLSKPSIEDNIAAETPELVLPPDFDVKPRIQSSNTYNLQDNRMIGKDVLIQDQKNNEFFEVPKAQNFVVPEVFFPAAKSPSDSIEKFRRNKKFSVGQWVYSQSVNRFKNGNLYYRPIYDKGYNFSRRYIPDSYKNDREYNFGNNYQNRNSSDLYNSELLIGEPLIQDGQEFLTIK
tara:strand:- start:589 stop:1203 length:615 start_codon:yes stop_codon:yes gene_type:complete